MKFTFLFFSFSLLFFHSFGQIRFESGYFLDNNNKRVECFIKNKDWKNNPKEFEYKFSINGETQKGNLNSAKEFGVAGFSKYIRAAVKIDVSSNDIDNLSKERNPEWSEDTLYLKVLTEGKAILYYYDRKGLRRFFYSITDTLINQLIYKEYYTADNQVAENVKFREQLWNDVRIENAGMNSIENIHFNTNELKNYFKKYNEQEGQLAVVYGKKEKKDSFHLKISPGINYSSLIIANTVNGKYNTKFNNQLNFRIGLEAEFIMPFNMNKWGFIFEPTFQYFYSEDKKSTSIETLHFNSVEFPIGLRYYFFLNEELKLFADAFFIPATNFGFHSELRHQSTISSISPSILKLNTGQNYSFGGGMGYKKISAELRFYTNRDIFRGYASWYSDYQKYSIILGYRIL